MSFKLRLLVNGETPTYKGKMLDDYLTFTQTNHKDRIDWPSLGVIDDIAASTARERLRRDKNIPSQKCPVGNPTKEDRKKQIREALLHALSQHRPDIE